MACVKQIAKSELRWSGKSPDWWNPYLGNEETNVLTRLVAAVAPKVMIEFGVQSGRTAKTLLDRIPSIETYIGIDVPPGHVMTLDCQASEQPQIPGRFAASDDRFFVLLSPSQELKAQYLEACDAVFIDGDHSRAAVLHDSRLARELIRPGGIIVWHDYGNGAVEVTQALDELEAEGWPIAHVAGTWLAFCGF